jgi:hypothetical protein
MLRGDMSWLPYSPYLIPLNFFFWSYFKYQIYVPPLPLPVEHLDELTLNSNSIPESTYSSTPIGVRFISVCHLGFIIRIFNACVKSVLLYGCETWLVTKEIQRKIQTFVNRCLRCILKIWWPNIISNKDLWKVTGQENINLEIRKRKYRWIGHTLRKEAGETPKAALLWNPQGNRKRGRPRNSWRRSVIKEAVRSWNELRFLAADRQKWKGLIDNLCS